MKARTVRPTVLFLCTGNACRSQMAEGFARAFRGDLIEPLSAGLECHGLDPLAVKVMAEAGVDISSHRSKTVEMLPDTPIQYVVTVCDGAGENCPVFPAEVRLVHRGFPDPPSLVKALGSGEEILECYRKVRDEIRDFVMTLPEALADRSGGR